MSNTHKIQVLLPVLLFFTATIARIYGMLLFVDKTEQSWLGSFNTEEPRPHCTMHWKINRQNKVNTASNWELNRFQKYLPVNYICSLHPLNPLQHCCKQFMLISLTRDHILWIYCNTKYSFGASRLELVEEVWSASRKLFEPQESFSTIRSD